MRECECVAVRGRAPRGDDTGGTVSRDGSEESGRRDSRGADSDDDGASGQGRPDHGQPDLSHPDLGGETALATWRELVARLELPSYIDPRHAPWPDLENLGQPPAGQSGPDRARVIRPASGKSFTGTTSLGTGFGSGPDGAELADSRYSDYDLEDADPADSRFLDDGGGSGDRYIPPPVPPAPRLDPVAKGAWTALVGGPGVWFAVPLLGWQVPGWAELLALVTFVAGFVILVSRLGDGPSRRDGPDQGAVI